jgi:hypothetical protein
MNARHLRAIAASPLLFLCACSDEVPTDLADTASDSSVSPDTAATPDSLGPIGAPSHRFFVRVDGGRSTPDGAPVLAATGDGGVIAAAAIRSDNYEDRELWVGRFGKSGTPLWQSVRDKPRKAGEDVSAIRTTGNLAIVLANETRSPGWPHPFFLRALSLDTGALAWEAACDPEAVSWCAGTELELDPAGDLLVTGAPAEDATELIVHRFGASGSAAGTVALAFDGVFVDFAVGPSGEWVAFGTTRADPPVPFIQPYSDSGAPGQRITLDPLPTRTSFVLARMTFAADGRLALTGATRDDNYERHAYGVVLAADGETLFSLPKTGSYHGPAAFAPGGDLYVASSEVSDIDGDLPGDYGELYAIRRTRFDREGTVRWSEQRRVQDHYLDSAQEFPSSLLADAAGIFVGSAGPSEALRDHDVYIERLDWASPLPPAPAEPVPHLVPKTLRVDDSPALTGPIGAPYCADDPTCPRDCASVCGVPLRIDAVTGLSGFTTSSPSVVSGDPDALVADGEDSTWFRDVAGGPWTTRWARSSRVTSSGLAVFSIDENQVVVLDTADPRTPVARGCISPPEGLGWHPSFTLGDRWLIIRSIVSSFEEGKESPVPGLHVYDLSSPDLVSSVRTLAADRNFAPVLDSDRLLAPVNGRLKLFDLAPETITEIEDIPLTGQFYNPTGIAGFALANGRAFDLRSDTLDEYVATQRDCGFDLTREDSAFSVVAGNPDRLTLGAAFDCAEDGSGSVVAEPAGERVAVQRGSTVSILRSDTVERTFELPATLVAWVDERLVAYPEQSCDFGCVGRYEVWSPETGLKTGELTEPASILSRTSDATSLYWLTYLDGVYGSDDFREPPATERSLRRVRPSTLTIESLPIPDGVEAHAVVAATEMLYLTTKDSRVVRLASDGAVLAEATLPSPPSRSDPLAVPGLGLFVQTDRGQWFWFSEDLAERRGTAGCFSAIPTGAIGTTVIGLRTIPSPAFWGSWAVEAWRAAPSGTSTWDLDLRVRGRRTVHGPSALQPRFGP